jgi:hypothetical protein
LPDVQLRADRPDRGNPIGRQLVGERPSRVRAQRIRDARSRGWASGADWEARITIISSS